jgi:hypothetical protein
MLLGIIWKFFRGGGKDFSQEEFFMGRKVSRGTFQEKFKEERAISKHYLKTITN